LATKGNQVTVSFTVNKALGATPVVMIGGQPMSQSSVSDMTYTFTRTLTGTETESVTSPITISVTDLDGNVTTGQTSFDIDFTSPAAPTVTGPTAAVSVTGSTYTITGTAAAGSLVRVYEGTTLVAWQQLGATATEYAITVPLNAGADNSFTVTATNQAGNVSAVTPVATVTQIAAAPVVVVPQATTTPAPVASPTPTPTSTASPTPSASPEAGQVAGAATTNSHNYTPWIILAILIALAILATAGYFYWFGGEITEEVAPTPVPPVTTPPSVMSSTTKTTTTKTGPPTTQAPPPKDNSQPEPPKKDKEKRW
jgi:hypothetical protein